MAIPLSTDMYRLELHWQQVLYEVEEEATLIEAYFSGPALKVAQKIEESDSIVIDMTSQYLVFLPSFYLAILYWEGITYSEDGKKIFLRGAKIKNKYINSIPKLNNTDYFIFDVANHEEKYHPYNLTYTTYLVNENGEIYKF